MLNRSIPFSRSWRPMHTVYSRILLAEVLCLSMEYGGELERVEIEGYIRMGQFNCQCFSTA